MDNNRFFCPNIHINNQEEGIRYLNPDDINLPPGYTIEVFAQGLNTPSGILFTEDGDMYIADNGLVTGNPSVLRLVGGNFEVVADSFNIPLSGINYLEGNLYVSHRGMITVIRRDGTREDIITGLPSFGDYSNSRVVFARDGTMYFGVGTATNSGVVGLDNLWIYEHPFIFDQPGDYILLKGQNYETRNILISRSNEIVRTGAFSPFGVPNRAFELRKGVTRASGSILRANLDGTGLELVAWGLRNPSYLQFDESNRLFLSNNGYEVRGSRPIANAPDEFQLISQGVWYGWPDYAGGEPVTLARFRPEGGEQPEFLLVNQPNIPPKPFDVFPPGSMITGFDFNYNPSFGPYGDVYIAEFGSIRRDLDGVSIPPYSGVGHRITRIDMRTGGVSTFAINRSGFPTYLTREGGLNRPTDLSFGPDGAMYVVDMGSNSIENPNVFLPNSGVIWKISRVK